MGAAVQLLDAVTAELDSAGLSALTVERQILPEIVKTGLTPTATVTLQIKEKFEVDRGNEFVKYTVGIGLHYPITENATLETALDMSEAIQDHLTSKANNHLTTASGTFKYLPPSIVEAPFDSELVKDAAIFFTVITMNYLFYKNRS